MKGKWRHILLFVLAFTFHLLPLHSVKAQVAGLSNLEVLDLSSTARTAGLGMDYLALFDNDFTIGIDNPSFLTSTMGGTGVLAFVPLFDGSNMGTLAYAHNFKHIGTVSFGFRFFNYGQFEGYDEEDNYEGGFGAGDYSLIIGWGIWIDSNYSIGVIFKPVLSQYESYTALAQAIDLAGSYVSDDRRFAATLMARNIGAQIVTFDNTVESLPFELSASLSYKLKGAPFRVFFTATELQKWNLRYEDPLHPTTTTDPFTGEVTSESWIEGTVDNLLRHTLIGVELSLGRSMFARVGYNYRRGREMVGADMLNMSGFSFGMGIRTKRFEFAYARRNYHLGQAPNYFTLSYRF